METIPSFHDALSTTELQSHEVCTTPESNYQLKTVTQILWLIGHGGQSFRVQLETWGEVLCSVSTWTYWWVYCSYIPWKLKNAEQTCWIHDWYFFHLNMNMIWASITCLLLQAVVAKCLWSWSLRICTFIKYTCDTIDWGVSNVPTISAHWIFHPLWYLLSYPIQTPIIYIAFPCTA